MLHATRNDCICSSCFKRPHDVHVYDHRPDVSRKRVIIKPWRPSAVEEVEISVWKIVYQQRQKRAHRKFNVIGSRKPSKQQKEDIEVVRVISPSEVFVEKPTSVNSRSLITDVDCWNFWDVVYGQSWKGRIRVCEGELMYKLRETLKVLVSRREITDFTVTRVFPDHSATNEDNGIPKQKVN